MVPRLVEHNTHNIINYHLKKCREHKFGYENFIFNLILFIFFASIVGIILYTSYRENSRENKISKENQKRNYIMSNLRKYQNMKNKPITNLPSFT
jgi:hypothetical protein